MLIHIISSSQTTWKEDSHSILIMLIMSDAQTRREMAVVRCRTVLPKVKILEKCPHCYRELGILKQIAYQ